MWRCNFSSGPFVLRLNIGKMTVAEFNKCVDQYSDNVFRFIVSNTRNESDAEDVVQNTYAILWERREEVTFEKAKSYLFTVARNNMIDNIRKLKRLDFKDSLPEGSATHNDFTGAGDALKEALGRLPEVQRTVVLLRDYEGYPYKDIADIVNLTETQVKVYIFRARKSLQQYLIKIDNVI